MHTHTYPPLLRVLSPNANTGGKNENKSKSRRLFFNKYFCLLPRHYESIVTITVFDAKTDRKLGYTETSIYRLQQRDADYYSGNWYAT